MSGEKRGKKRFSDMSLLYIPVRLEPVPPYVGSPIRGNLLDISASGMAFQIEKEIPAGTVHQAQLTFPDRSLLACQATIVRAEKVQNRFLIGLKFDAIPDYMERKIERMAVDYNRCEERIRAKEKDVCFIECAFFSMCRKEQKFNKENDIGIEMGLQLKAAQEPSQESPQD